VGGGLKYEVTGAKTRMAITIQQLLIPEYMYIIPKSNDDFRCSTSDLLL
jgi:hypothetical protein